MENNQTQEKLLAEIERLKKELKKLDSHFVQII